MVYANPKMTTMQIPENSSNDTVFESYRGGKRVASYTNNDIVGFADNLWKNHFSSRDTKPTFMSIDLETPLAFASFVANTANLKKVFIPSTFNMNKILKGLKH